MGFGLPPQGLAIGVFGSLLKAQELSQTLLLAHAGIGDEGANEVAHFMATNTKLLRVDLTGNRITSTGAAHLAGAIRQNVALESLVLRHNHLGEEGGEVGLRTLCRAIRENKVLQHVDLRNNGLSGPLVAALLGEMLQGNSSVSHLELSWNPLGALSGQVLLDYLRQNSTLIDCQLTGCGIAEETLLDIARLLHRNRIAQGVKLEAGPWRVQLERGGPSKGLPASPRGLGGTFNGTHGEDCDPEGIPLPGMTSELLPSSAVISSERTAELREQLVNWKLRCLSEGRDARAGQEFLEILNHSEKALEAEVDGVDNLRIHLNCLTHGYQDRTLRYQSDADTMQADLRDRQRELEDLRAVQTRASQDLHLGREALKQVQEDKTKVERYWEGEDVACRTRLAEVQLEQEATQARLHELQEALRQLEEQNALLRSRTSTLREDVVLLQHSERHEN